MPALEPFRIAFVEPDLMQADQLGRLLEFEGFAVSLIGSDDLPRLPQLAADLVLLNHRRLRDSTLAIAGSLAGTPESGPLTLALVAQGDELQGLELVERGLDAYLGLPCGSREFVARVRAMLRRARRTGANVGGGCAEPLAGHALRVSNLHIDPSRRRVRLHGRDLRLTEQEFQLLYFLAGHPGRVFDRQALLDAVWGNDTFVTVRSVDALVKRLRHQLRMADHGDTCVETVRGVGYRLAERHSAASASAA
jgi:DNA-binding response OmpR family regulator